MARLFAWEVGAGGGDVFARLNGIKCGIYRENGIINGIFICIYDKQIETIWYLPIFVFFVFGMSYEEKSFLCGRWTLSNLCLTFPTWENKTQVAEKPKEIQRVLWQANIIWVPELTSYSVPKFCIDSRHTEVPIELVSPSSFPSQGLVIC